MRTVELVGSAPEDRARAQTDVYPVGHKNINTAEDRACVDSAVALKGRAAQVALDTSEHRVKLRAVESSAGIIQLCAGKGRISLTYVVALDLDILPYPRALIRHYRMDYQANAYHDYHSGHEQLPHHREAEYSEAAEQQTNADAQSDYTAGLVTVGDQADKGRNNNKQRPPAVKEDIDVCKTDGIQCENNAYRRYCNAP